MPSVHAFAHALFVFLAVHRYTKGQHFGRHIDESAEVAPGQWTAYTLLIYLSGGLTGGETLFYGETRLQRPFTVGRV